MIGIALGSLAGYLKGVVSLSFEYLRHQKSCPAPAFGLKSSLLTGARLFMFLQLRRELTADVKAVKAGLVATADEYPYSNYLQMKRKIGAIAGELFS